MNNHSMIDAEDLIEMYGFSRILEDFELDLPQVLDILDELKFIDLSLYREEN